MHGKKLTAIAVKRLMLIVMLGTAWHAIAQDAKAPYPSMAPVDQYLMEDRNSEIALAQSAASREMDSPTSWSLGLTVTKLRLRGRTASCAW